MQIQYCLPIIKNKKNKVLEIINQNIHEYDFFEVWLEYVEDIDDAFIETIKNLLDERLILVFRRQLLGEIQMNREKRKQIILSLQNSNVLIDCDIFQQKEELEWIQQEKIHVKTIVSFHNYQETPDNSQLEVIIDTMGEYNPTIVKIATMCNSHSNALRLMHVLLELRKKQIHCIVLGMGEQGVITRVFGTLWGNEMIFAPKDISENSAPGQLTKVQLDTIFKGLEDTYGRQ